LAGDLEAELAGMSEVWCGTEAEGRMQELLLPQHVEQLLCCCSRSHTVNTECPTDALSKLWPSFQEQEACPYSPSARNAKTAQTLEWTLSSSEGMGDKRVMLRAKVASFIKKAVAGVEVMVVDPETRTATDAFFLIDCRLSVCSLKVKQERSALALVFNMLDVTSVYKGRDVSERMPALASVAKFCVGMDMSSMQKRLFFLFDDATDKDEFYTSFRILRLSAEFGNAL